MMGILAASSLSARLRRLELCVSLLGEISGRLSYLQPTTQSLIAALAAQARFAAIGFLRKCAAEMGRGEPFSPSWQLALEGERQALGREESALLASLGDVLGRSDLDSQLNAIALTREQFEQRLAERREKMRKQESLYRSMGVLGGVAAAIILI